MYKVVSFCYTYRWALRRLRGDGVVRKSVKFKVLEIRVGSGRGSIYTFTGKGAAKGRACQNKVVGPCQPKFPSVISNSVAEDKHVLRGWRVAGLQDKLLGTSISRGVAMST